VFALQKTPIGWTHSPLDARHRARSAVLGIRFIPREQAARPDQRNHHRMAMINNRRLI
jgi:hypothetical protein